MNLCHARIEQGNGGLVARFGSMELGIDAASLAHYPKVTQRAGQELVLGLRPECFSLSDGDAPESERLRAKVDLVEMLGAEALVYLKSDAKPVSSRNLVELSSDEAKAGTGTHAPLSIVARISPRRIPKVGDIVDVRYEPDSLHFFDPGTGHALRSL